MAIRIFSRYLLKKIVILIIRPQKSSNIAVDFRHFYLKLLYSFVHIATTQKNVILKII